MNYQLKNFQLAQNRKTLCATADLILENKVCICGIKLIRNRNKTLFLSFPTQKSGDYYVEIIRMLDPSMQKSIEQEMIALYQCKS